MKYEYQRFNERIQRNRKFLKLIIKSFASVLLFYVTWQIVGKIHSSFNSEGQIQTVSSVLYLTVISLQATIWRQK